MRWLTLCSGMLFVLASSVGAEEGTIFAGSGGTDWKPQSKLFYNDGSWHGIFLDGADHYIHRLEGGVFQKLPTGFVDTRNSGKADVLWNGTNLFVVVGHNSVSYFYKFSYSTTTRTYTLLSGFPVLLPLDLGYSHANLAQDSTGRVWVSHLKGRTVIDPDGAPDTVGDIRVLWSTSSDHTTWDTTGVVLASAVFPDDVGALAAYDGKVGIFISDQERGRFEFRYHTDTDAPSSWSSPEVVSTDSFLVDNHVNVAVTPSHEILVCTKGGGDLVYLWVRDPVTGWSGPHSVAGLGTRPIVLYDESADEVYVLYTDLGTSDETIALKQIALADVANFALAPAETFLSGPVDINNVTGTKQNLTSTTGLAAAAKGDDSLIYWRVEVTDPGNPTVSISASATQGTTPLTVDFTSDADDPDGTIDTYAWTFGDGGSSSAVNPSHTYTSSGVYETQLVVTDDDGKTASAKVTIVVTSEDDPTPGGTLAQINFQPSGAAIPAGYAPDMGATYDATRGYGWDTPLGGTERDSSADQRHDTFLEHSNSSAPATWEYALTNGQYFVTFVVGDPVWSGYHTVALEGVVVLSNAYTKAEFVEMVDQPVTVTDGRLSVRIGGAIGGKKCKLCYLHITNAGSSGGGGGGEPTNAQPTAGASASVTSGEAPLVVNFTGTGTDTDGTIVSWAWNFGDGNSSTSQSPTHTYLTAGTFVAQLTVTDNQGGTDQDSVTIDVTAPPVDPGGTLARINFQPSGAVIPAGYDPDYGQVFDSVRGYGWNDAVATEERDAHSDQRLDSYVYSRNTDPAVSWEYALANGQYFVTVVAGSPLWNGVHAVALEGTTIMDNVATGSGEFVEVVDRLVTVSDGRLTVRIGGSGANRKTKLCYVEIRAAE